MSVICNASQARPHQHGRHTPSLGRTSSCEIISTLHSTLSQLFWRFILENIFKSWEWKISFFSHHSNIARLFTISFCTSAEKDWQLVQVNHLLQIINKVALWPSRQLKCGQELNISTRYQNGDKRLINGSSTARPDTDLNKFEVCSTDPANTGLASFAMESVQVFCSQFADKLKDKRISETGFWAGETCLHHQ